jgi:hypothetical protein
MIRTHPSSICPVVQITVSAVDGGTGLPEDRWHDSDQSVAVDILLAGAATLPSLWSDWPSFNDLRGPGFGPGRARG